MGKIELITPTREIVSRYYNLWFDSETNDWQVQLFKNVQVTDIKKYTRGNPHINYGLKDKEIEQLWNSGEVEAFLKRINAIYSTQVKNIGDLSFTKKELKEMTIDEFIGRCKKVTGTYAYSFASKVFSFIDPDNHPIIDSLVSTLIWEYLSPENQKHYPRTGWGNYSKYIEAYDAFLKQYGLEPKSYKKTDIFLWTYAVAIQEYWKTEIGVLSFAPIQYKN